MAKREPSQGGCWFCHRDDDRTGGWFFSIEFDTYLHVTCLLKAAKRNRKLRKNLNAEDAETAVFETEFKEFIEAK